MQRGFVYLGLLFWVALAGVGLAAVGTVWSTKAQREREQELVFVGSQFQAALESYLLYSPEAARQLPKSLDELLADSRSGSVRRHLRRVYVDPMTGRDEWGLVREPDGRIRGVYSLSDRRPFRSTGLPRGVEVRDGGARYADWKFVVSPGAPVAVAAVGTGGPPAAGPTGPGGLPAPSPGQPPVDDGAGGGSSGSPDVDPLARPERCTEPRRQDMVRCLALPREQKVRCETESNRRYAQCLQANRR